MKTEELKPVRLTTRLTFTQDEIDRMGDLQQAINQNKPADLVDHDNHHDDDNHHHDNHQDKPEGDKLTLDELKRRFNKATNNGRDLCE